MMPVIQINPSEIKKILIIKLRGIGDVVLSTIVFDSILSNFPGASIDFVTDPPSVKWLQNLEFLSKVYSFDRKSTFNRIKLASDLRKQKYDLVLDLFSNPASAQLTFASGAKYRAGFPYRGRRYAYNLFGPPERDKYHSAQLHLEFLKNIGIKVNKSKLYYSLDNSDITYANKYFKDNQLNNKLVVGILPGGGWASKKCDPIKFAEIADAVNEKYKSTIIILWGPDDKKDSLEIQNLMKNESLLAPPSTISEMAALQSKCSVIIANDSGPMHICAAVGTPVLGLFGPTNPRMQGPFGDQHEWIQKDDLDCIECNLLQCPRNHECFFELDINQILKKVDTLLNKNDLLPK